MAKITVAGKILRDKDDETKRNYVVLHIRAIGDGGEHVKSYSLVNYAPNGGTLKHLLLIKAHDSEEECKKLCENHTVSKMARDRIVFREINCEFDDAVVFCNFISSIEVKVEIKKAKSFAAGIKSRLESYAESKRLRAAFVEEDEDEDEDELGARVEVPLDDEDEDGEGMVHVDESELLERERTSGLGKETSATNTGWGLF
jgi:hypothetical protein